MTTTKTRIANEAADLARVQARRNGRDEVGRDEALDCLETVAQRHGISGDAVPSLRTVLRLANRYPL